MSSSEGSKAQEVLERSQKSYIGVHSLSGTEEKISEQVEQTVNELEEALVALGFSQDKLGKRLKKSIKKEIGRLRWLQLCKNIKYFDDLGSSTDDKLSCLQTRLAIDCAVASHGLFYDKNQPNLLAVRGLCYFMRDMPYEALGDWTQALSIPLSQWYPTNDFSLHQGVKDTYNTLFVHSLDRGSWQEVRTHNTPSTGLANAAYCTTPLNFQLYIFGGFHGQAHDGQHHIEPQSTNELWCLDLQAMQWQQIIQKKKKTWPCERCGARLTPISNETIALHGGKICHEHLSPEDDDVEDVLLGDLWFFHTASQKWSYVQTKGPKPSKRCDHVLVARNKIIFCWGGLNADDKMWLIDLNQIEFFWTALPEVQTPRQHCAYGLIGQDTLLILGGTSIQPNNKYVNGQEQLHFNLNTFTWTNLRHQGRRFPGHTESAAVMHNDQLFVFGGYSDARTVTTFCPHKDDGIRACPMLNTSFYYNTLFRFVTTNAKSSIRYATPAGDVLPKRAALAVASIDPQGNFICWGGYSTLTPCQTHISAENQDTVYVFNTVWCYKLDTEVSPKKKHLDFNDLDTDKESDHDLPTTDISKEKSLSIRGLKNACHLNGQYARLVQESGDRLIMELVFPRRKVSVPRTCVAHSKQFDPKKNAKPERGVQELKWVHYDSWLEACRQVLARDMSKRQAFSKFWLDNYYKYQTRSANTFCRAALIAKYDHLRPPRPHDQMHISHFVWVNESDLDKYFTKPHERVFTVDNNKFWREMILRGKDEDQHYGFFSFLVILIPYLHDPFDDDIPETDLDLNKEKHAYLSTCLNAWTFSLAPGYGYVSNENQIVQAPPEATSLPVEVQRLLNIDDYEQVPTKMGPFRCCFNCRKISKPNLVQRGYELQKNYSPAIICENLQACANCKAASYCSKQCQVADWTKHKNRVSVPPCEKGVSGKTILPQRKAGANSFNPSVHDEQY